MSLSAPQQQALKIADQKEPQMGFMTEAVRKRFIEYALKNNLIMIVHQDNKNDNKNTTMTSFETAEQVLEAIPSVASLVAPTDMNKPIQMWQLHSVLGADIVKKLVEMFYDRVFDDKANPWFRNPFFFSNDKDQHVFLQLRMWLDIFGGGKVYFEEGEERLEYRHARAMEIMTTKGALRWIEHMEAVIEEVTALPPATEEERKEKPNQGLLVKFCNGNMEMVQRVMRSLSTFLGFFMDDYAKQFDFDEYNSCEAATSRKTPFFGPRNPAIDQNGNAILK